MDGYIDNLNHPNIFTSGSNEPSVKTIVVALATAIGAWGGFPKTPLKVQKFFDDNEFVRYFLVWILIWQGGSDQNWKLATVITLLMYGITLALKEKVKEKTVEERVKALEDAE
uniref:Uncharacterized protein n=1 Tax=viral metagenome TaxID=1070528 RepID=A0A6C0J4B9_9ZZZZ